MNNIFTRRETVTLIVIFIFAITIALLTQFTAFEMTEGWQYFFAVLLFSTLGPYIVLDPERIIRKGN